VRERGFFRAAHQLILELIAPCACIDASDA
jgi:hypothetical protein